MWFNDAVRPDDWSPALRHLRRDPVLAALIKTVGPCTLKPRKDYFVVLCKAIYSQQISTKVAATLFGRFRDLFPQRRPTPARVIEVLSSTERSHLAYCGLSRQKHAYLLDLARHFVDGRIPTARLSRMPDEAVIQSLTQVHGIGRWTAEMFLMFVLNRPDLLPVDDLGLRNNAQRAYALSTPVTAKALTALGEGWRPYRTVASWYLWRLPPS